jgi:tetratricopeptide (TPR) repeat protein
MEVFMRAFEKNGSTVGRWRHLATAASVGAVLFVVCLGFCARSLAAPSFQEAVAQYNSGKFAQAVSTLEVVEASYPNNALVHYYMALSQQAIGHLEKAKAEYQWVISSRDPKLAPQATVGLSQLAGARTTGSGGGRTMIASAAPAPASGGGGGQKAGKVKKVLDFWATW